MKESGLLINHTFQLNTFAKYKFIAFSKNVELISKINKQIFSYISLKIQKTYNFYNHINRKVKYNDLISLLKVFYIFENINQLSIFLALNTLPPIYQLYVKL